MPDVYNGSITLVSVADGTDGTTYYTWIRYSNGATTNPSVTPSPQADTKQIGFAYNKTSSTPTSNYNDYVWSDYIGTSGVGVSNIIEQYYLSTSNITQTGGSWTTTPAPWSANHYYWTRSEITWTDNTITYTDPVLAVDINQINQNLVNLQSQVDGQIQTWYYEGTPTLNNAPANTWTTTVDKDKHIGDLYYDKSTGYAYRFMYDNTTSTYVWTKITDSDVTEALQLAESKSTVWVVQPTVPYYAGDLWVVINQDGSKTIYSCTQDRTTGSFTQGDWIVTATDDTTANAAVAAATAITETAITNVDVYYAKNTSSTTAPAGYGNPAASSNWSTDPPQWTDGDFIWSVTVTTKNGQDTVNDPVCITGAKGATGAPAPYIVLSGPTNVVTVDNNTSPVTISPSGNIDIIATTSANISNITWSYKVNGATSSTTPSYISNITNGKRVNATTFANTSGTNTLTIIASSNDVSDTYTLTKLVNGTNGTNGTDAIEIVLSNESHTLTAAADGTISSYSGASTTVYIYEGITDKSSNYTITKTDPSGISSVISGKTVTVNSVTNGIGGVITITVKKGSATIGTKQFSISVSKTGATGATGATGNGISSITVTYGTSSSGTDPTTVTQWSSTVPAVAQGNYLWTKTVINYTNGTSSNPSYSAVYHSEDGKAPIYDIELSNEKIYKVANDSQSITTKPDDDLYFDVFKTEEGSRETFSSFSYDLEILGGMSLKELLTAAQFQTYFIKNGNRVTFKLKNFLDADFSENEDYEDLQNFQDTIKIDNVYLLVRVWKENEAYASTNLLAKAVISVEFANDMKVSITNSMMQASISTGKMEYTLNGLTIYNGGFKIIDRNNGIDVPLFGYDEEKQSLYVRGNGEFTGRIVAESSSFSGTVDALEITAHSGIIGGFNIAENELYSSDSNTSVRLNGIDGSIFARNITLGDNAIIDGSLKAGKIENTNSYYTELTGEGKLILGGETGLTLDGATSTIKANNGSFMITPNFAEFNNIIAKGKISASVFEINSTQAVGGAMIFKPSYKVESKTNNENTTDLILDKDFGNNTDLTASLVVLIDENGSNIGRYIAIKDNNNPRKISIASNISANVFSVIDLEIRPGHNTSLIIGVNSNEASDYLRGRGFTISEISCPYVSTITSNGNSSNAYVEYNNTKYYTANGTFTFNAGNTLLIHCIGQSAPYTSQIYINDVLVQSFEQQVLEYNYTLPAFDVEITFEYGATTIVRIVETSSANIIESGYTSDLKVFLGDLQNSGLGSGYGLYSSNVYLTGSLITRTVSSGNSFYAGVNTLNGVLADRNKVGDDSEIIFWAGSENNDPEYIRKAPFQVTRNGVIYAQRGKFEGAIISESTIQGASIIGADIYAATIHGTGNDPCLKIYDISGAIGFFSEYSEFTGSSFISGVTYYEKNESNEFFITGDESVQDGKVYYIKEESRTLTINQEGLEYLGNRFITLSSDLKEARFNKYYTDNLCLDNNRIYTLSENRYLAFNDSSTVKLNYNEGTYISLGEQEILLSDSTVKISNIFALQDTLQYKPAYDTSNELIGYNLYIN